VPLDYRRDLTLVCVQFLLRRGGLSKRATKKADVAEHPKEFNHVGLLFNEPPARAGCSSSSFPTTFANLMRLQYRATPGKSKLMGAFIRGLLSCDLPFLAVCVFPAHNNSKCAAVAGRQPIQGGPRRIPDC
jgi:hypothetical protein